MHPPQEFLPIRLLIINVSLSHLVGFVVYSLDRDSNDILKRFDPCCLLTPPPPPLFPPPPGVWKREPVSDITLVYIILTAGNDSMSVNAPFICFSRPCLVVWRGQE